MARSRKQTSYTQLSILWSAQVQIRSTLAMSQSMLTSHKIDILKTSCMWVRVDSRGLAILAKKSSETPCSHINIFKVVHCWKLILYLWMLGVSLVSRSPGCQLLKHSTNSQSLILNLKFKLQPYLSPNLDSTLTCNLVSSVKSACRLHYYCARASAGNSEQPQAKEWAPALSL